MSCFAWILILLCTSNFLPTFAHQDSEMLRSKDFLISSNLENHDSDHARKLTAAAEISLTGRGQKGKGAYGGANVVHRRPGDKSAAAALHTPCFFNLSAINLALSSFIFWFSFW
ncbi:hypothetical protein C2S52_005312 [Perilla frutescens var. hirtella]|uniref:Transmembrane protein n=1 Tax=Perilla frutescens var. hirtella TaxID=608512 RepID=A0AAD4IQZ4_PERFH|nr:hypothetical protein C2S51_010344 [Perilla frutescens var. frutescens]KAH6794835.1 hypothetical protein C2S52_005312 [Perilla frutescens var. hirtella]KAH6819950.1 hypothetical protein C2S53_014594 [Perilla frutescens var. hirtella]